MITDFFHNLFITTLIYKPDFYMFSLMTGCQCFLFDLKLKCQIQNFLQINQSVRWGRDTKFLSMS